MFIFRGVEKMGNKDVENIKQILHIVPDATFIDVACQMFETVLPQGNEYVCLGDKHKAFRHIKSSLVKRLPCEYIYTKEFRDYLKQFKAIVFHSFSGINNFCIAISAPAHAKKLWIGWGFDYYDLLSRTEELFKTQTLSLYKKKTGKSVLRISKRASKSFILSSLKKICIRRFDFFAPVIYEDYEVVKSKINWMNAKFISWNYGNHLPIKDIRLNGDNVLVGNSASYTNNHLEIFESLSKYNLEGRKVICPLSYGDEEYRDYIIVKGRDFFGDSFVPLETFLTLEEYMKIISTCSLVFMNHLRQQAVGNIDMALMFGSKVFLDPANPLFRHYQNIGVRLFSINDLNESIFSRLPNESVTNNRSLILKHRSKEVILNKTQYLINELLR